MRISEARLREILSEEIRSIMEEEGTGDAIEMYPTPVDGLEMENDELPSVDEGKSVKKRKGMKASAGSIAIFKKAARKTRGGETKKKRAGFDAVKKSAEEWGAKNPAAVAQAATIVATGEPVVAKGEKRGRLKKESVENLDRLIIID